MGLLRRNHLGVWKWPATCLTIGRMSEASDDLAAREGPTDDELIELSKEGALLNTIFGHRADGSEAFLDQLAALHDAGRIDILDLPLDRLALLDNRDFFNGHARFCQIIPRLSGEPLAMMRLVNALVERAGEDLSSNWPNSAYLEWAKGDPERARIGVELERGGDPDARKLLRCNLEAGSFVDLAIEMTTLADQERRLPAVFALSRMPLSAEQALEALVALQAVVEAFSDDVTAANVLHAALEIGKRHGLLEQPAASVLILAALNNAGPQTHYAVASNLFDGARDLPAPVVGSMLEVACGVDRTHTRTISLLDTALSRMVEGPHSDLAEATIERLITAGGQGIPASNLASCGRSLLKYSPERLSRLVAHWLLSEHHVLREALETFFSMVDRKEAMAFTLAGLELSPRDQLLLCRRACGYFFIRPELAASILVGVLREGAPEIRPHVQELLFDPLAANYGGMAQDYLAAIPKDDPGFTAVASVLKRLKARNTALGKAGFLKELAPSASKRQLEAQRSASTMREAFKKAERKSVLLDLVSRETLLHGRASLSYFRGPGEQADRSMVTELHGMSYSFELPREDVLDPVGLSLKILGLRHGVLHA